MRIKPTEEQIIAGSGGIALFRRSWTVDDDAVGRIVIIHGIGEHGGRYDSIVSDCLERNVEVTAVDLRGHGKSEGRRGHVDHWDLYLEDQDLVGQSLGGWDQSVPVYLLGHSFGALVALDYMLSKEPKIAGLVISGVPLQPGGVAGPAKILLVKIVSRFVPMFSIPLDIAPEALSSLPEVVEAYKKDPLVFGHVTARWGAESLKAVKRVRDGLSEIASPLLVIHGDADSVNLVEGAKELYHGAGSQDKELYLDPGGYHEPHNDTNRKAVAGKIGDWLTR